jgi:hypothetical protein
MTNDWDCFDEKRNIERRDIKKIDLFITSPFVG